MSKFIILNLAIFPQWIQVLLVYALAIFLLTLLLYSTIKLIQTSVMSSFFSSIPPLLNKLGKFLHYQIDDPIKYPRILRVIGYVNIGFSYLLCVMLIMFFIMLMLLWTIAGKDLSLTQHVIVLVSSLFCMYMAAVLKTQGNRDILKLRKND